MDGYQPGLHPAERNASVPDAGQHGPESTVLQDLDLGAGRQPHRGQPRGKFPAAIDSDDDAAAAG